MSFKPYRAPHADRNGSITAGSDLCWRINWQDQSDTVTPAVMGAVVWAFRHFQVAQEQRTEILSSLGLEEITLPNGEQVVRPKH